MFNWRKIVFHTSPPLSFSTLLYGVEGSGSLQWDLAAMVGMTFLLVAEMLSQLHSMVSSLLAKQKASQPSQLTNSQPEWYNISPAADGPSLGTNKNQLTNEDQFPGQLTNRKQVSSQLSNENQLVGWLTNRKKDWNLDIPGLDPDNKLFDQVHKTLLI